MLLRFVGKKLDHVGFSLLSFVIAEIPLPCFEGHFLKTTNSLSLKRKFAPYFVIDSRVPFLYQFCSSEKGLGKY